jgi:hypothetical protein
MQKLTIALVVAVGTMIALPALACRTSDCPSDRACTPKAIEAAANDPLLIACTTSDCRSESTPKIAPHPPDDVACGTSSCRSEPSSGKLHEEISDDRLQIACDTRPCLVPEPEDGRQVVDCSSSNCRSLEAPDRADDRAPKFADLVGSGVPIVLVNGKKPCTTNDC